MFFFFFSWNYVKVYIFSKGKFWDFFKLKLEVNGVLYKEIVVFIWMLMLFGDFCGIYELEGSYYNIKISI